MSVLNTVMLSANVIFPLVYDVLLIYGNTMMTVVGFDPTK